MPGKDNHACAEAILGCFEAHHRTAFRLTRNKSQAEDLVQEAYLRAWRSLSELQSLSSVQPRMFRILRTTFVDRLNMPTIFRLRIIFPASKWPSEEAVIARFAVRVGMPVYKAPPELRTRIRVLLRKESV